MTINRVEQLIKHLRPEWMKREIQISQLKGGITNELYLVEDLGKCYVVRIPGEKTDLFLDRDTEVKNLHVLEATGVTPKVVDYKVDSKIVIFEFIPGRAATMEDFKDPKVRERTIASVKRIHTSNVKLYNNFNVFNEIDRYFNLSKMHGDYILKDYPIKKLLNLTRILRKEIDKEQTKLVACHNDLLPGNIILSGEKVYIIDWEYGGMNDPYFDVADFIVEISDVITSDEEEHIKQLYFGKKDESAERRVDFYKFLCDFVWSLWAVNQYHVSKLNFNFEEYARTRFERTLKYAEMLKEKYGIHY
ncbi:MAG: phosphotransferase [Candidatus Bathyarchaeia archaeon]